ncbi:MAG: hypothetical protein FWG34_12075 [Oscillospiraceae bacterium]|nr:hypothetical protein [Oscillospiraceae bacterium]
MKLQKHKSKHSFRIRGIPFETYGNNVITGVVSAKKLNETAKANKATITSYLASLLVYSIYMASQKYTHDKNPIIICVPVNLRKAFPSKTLRNFFVTANIGMNVNSATKLEEIISEMTAQLKKKTETFSLQELISNNVKYENNIYTKLVPLFLKKIFILIGFNIMGETKKSMTLSNMGNISIPEGLASKINLMEAVLYPTPKSPINCGICSVNDKLAISFSRTIIETDIIRYFLNYISENVGLDVAVYSNDWGESRE